MEGDIVCAFSGRMIGIKGLDVMKEAFELLRGKHPNIHLWLCGVPDRNNPGSWTEDQLAGWSQAPNVAWKGYCEDMPSVWKQVHIALQPSHGGEGIPKSLLEAAACGRPIIATNVPGCREVVEHEKNGLLIAPKDAHELARAIEELALDPEKCRKFAKASPSVIREKGLSASRITQMTKALYEKLAAQE
jgi:glycosyltransferase involved in cell wall biosynthesis